MPTIEVSTNRHRTTRLEVALGILCRGDGALLIQQRRSGTACAGQWEFPGGKIESGETPETALERELNEELGIHPLESKLLTVLDHDYPHAQVRLHSYIVGAWDGLPSGVEGQNIAWVDHGQIRRYELLEAAYPLLELMHGVSDSR